MTTHVDTNKSGYMIHDDTNNFYRDMEQTDDKPESTTRSCYVLMAPVETQVQLQAALLQATPLTVIHQLVIAILRDCHQQKEETTHFYNSLIRLTTTTDKICHTPTDKKEPRTEHKFDPTQEFTLEIPDSTNNVTHAVYDIVGQLFNKLQNGTVLMESNYTSKFNAQ